MNEYEISLWSVVAINVILALSLNVISGFCGQISLGQAAFYGTGAYAAAKFSLSGMSFVPTLAFATVLSGAFGFVIGVASLRVRNDFLAVTTMGVGFLFLGVVRKQKWLGGELGLTNLPSSGMSSLEQMILFVAAAFAVVLGCLYLKRSWMGFGFEAIARDEDAALTIGVNVPGFKLAAFAIGSGIAGLAGGFYAYFSKAVLPDTFSFLESVAILTAVVVGGTGSVIGVVFAAVLLTLLPEWFRFVSDYRLLVLGALLILVMLLSPGGFAGLFAKLSGGRKLP